MKPLKTTFMDVINEIKKEHEMKDWKDMKKWTNDGTIEGVCIHICVFVCVHVCIYI